MELMLAMGVIAFLLIGVAGLIIQMTNTITRGTTYKDLNTAARTINTDFTKTFNSSPMLDDWNGNVDGKFYKSTGKAGAFCTGTVTYLWNIGDGRQIVFSDISAVKLVKVRDTTRSYCTDGAENTIWRRVPRDNNVTEILTSSEIDLRIHGINFSTSPNLRNSASNQMIINISYILGTPNNGDIDVSTYNCEGNIKSNYCAVNRFDLTVRTLGK